MAFRFQRRIQLIPGVRLNLSKSGVGFSVGPRGAAVSVGSRGVHRHIGIPGTGIAFREQISGPRSRRASLQGGRGERVHMEVKVRLEDDGSVTFRMEDDTPAPPALERKARRDHGDMLRDRLADLAAERNTTLEACLGIHLQTPPPVYTPAVQTDPAPVPPEPPHLRSVSLWDRLLFRRRRIEAENTAEDARHADAIKAWEITVAEHHANAREIEALNAAVRGGEAEAVAAVIAERLSGIAWAQPTEVSFDFGDDTSTLSLDVDLPESNEIPDTLWVVAARGLSLRGQRRSDAQKRRDFSYLAHATLFRIAGEAFCSLPTLREVTLSSYTQRLAPATGETEDVYILSVRIDREQWDELRFDRLDAIDVAEALGRFDLIRRQTRSGELQAIEPHSAKLNSQ